MMRLAMPLPYSYDAASVRHRGASRGAPGLGVVASEGRAEGAAQDARMPTVHARMQPPAPSSHKQTPREKYQSSIRSLQSKAESGRMVIEVCPWRFWRPSLPAVVTQHAPLSVVCIPLGLVAAAFSQRMPLLKKHPATRRPMSSRALRSAASIELTGTCSSEPTRDRRREAGVDAMTGTLDLRTRDEPTSGGGSAALNLEPAVTAPWRPEESRSATNAEDAPELVASRLQAAPAPSPSPASPTPAPAHAPTPTKASWLNAMHSSRDPIVMALATLGCLVDTVVESGEEALGDLFTPESKRVQKMLQMMGLEMGEQLGKGTAGVVHEAVSLAPDKTERVWRGPDHVAVKMLHPKGNGQWQKDTFKREMTIWKPLRHAHVVQVHCAVHSSTMPHILVMEMCEQGRLYDAMRGASKRALDVPSLALDLGRALAYCHSQGVAHRDVKSPNVMLAWDLEEQRLVAKLCDFGSACRVEDVGEAGPGEEQGDGGHKQIGTPLWMAPEMLDAANQSRTIASPAASDVFSFGMIVWEMLTGELPWADKFRGRKADPPTPQEVVAHVFQCVVTDNLRPTLPAWVHSDVASVLTACWQADPRDRPPMLQVVEMLEQIPQWDTDGHLELEAQKCHEWAKEQGLLASIAERPPFSTSPRITKLKAVMQASRLLANARNNISPVADGFAPETRAGVF